MSHWSAWVTCPSLNYCGKWWTSSGWSLRVEKVLSKEKRGPCCRRWETANKINRYSPVLTSLVMGISVLPNAQSYWENQKYIRAMKTVWKLKNSREMGVILKVMISLPFPHTVPLLRMPFAWLSKACPPFRSPPPPGTRELLQHLEPLGCLWNPSTHVV